MSRTVTVQHDDSPAFAAATTAARSSGGQMEIYIPAGNYNCHGYNQPPGTGRRPACINLDGLSNVTFEGDGVGKTNIYNLDGEFIVGLCGYGNTVACQNEYFGNMGHGYALSDPSLVGSGQITLKALSSVSNFSVGEYITIFDNSSFYPQEYYGEINKVKSINGETGVITLAYPLTKTYSSLLPAPYSTCSRCSGTPMAEPISGGPVASGISLRNFSFRGPVDFLNVNTIDGLTEDSLNVTAQQILEDGAMRHLTITNSKFLEDPWSPNPTEGFFNSAAASTDAIAVNDTYINPHYSSGSQECSEGGANIYALNVTRLISGSTDPPRGQSGGVPNFFGIAMCWNYVMQGNLVTISNANGSGLYGGDAGYGGSGTIEGNTFSVDTVSGSSPASIGTAQAFGYPMGSPYILVDKNKWNTPTGLNLGRTSANTNVPSSGSRTFAGVENSGLVDFSRVYGSYSIFIVTLNSNLTRVNFGTSRKARYFFTIVLIEPSSGSTYDITESCSNSTWLTGKGIDCANLHPPQLIMSNGSATVLTFWDDGAKVHLIGMN